MLTDPMTTLKQFVNQPSGSRDPADVADLAKMIAPMLRGLGFTVELHSHSGFGPTLTAHIGEGEKALMLMGHMDTVFSRDQAVPFTDHGDGTAKGSGIMDMKGGIVILLYALQKALPLLDLKKSALTVVLNPDEEIGSLSSKELILENARASFAALSFEPAALDGRLTCARKGVTDVTVACAGVPGHAGAAYQKCASAVQALCAQITKLYTLRDDARDISFNAGVISGGTAENIVAAEASCKCEFRYYNEAYKSILMEKITALCADEPVPNVKTTVTFSASHPAVDLNEKSQKLLFLAQSIAEKQGRVLRHERTGGAGDISIAAQTGVPVLDGLGLQGDQMHTAAEYALLDPIPQQIDLAAEMIRQLINNQSTEE